MGVKMTSEKIVDFELNVEDTFLDISKFYKFVEHPDNSAAEYKCIKLLYGEFAGLIYRYGRTKIGKRDNPDSSRTINFEYDIIQIPDQVKGVSYPPEKEKEFFDLLANVLIDIMNKWAVKNKKETLYVKDEDVENRDNDTEKSVARRTIYPAGDPLSKE
jgi:hypothetical protein